MRGGVEDLDAASAPRQENIFAEPRLQLRVGECMVSTDGARRGAANDVDAAGDEAVPSFMFQS